MASAKKACRSGQIMFFTNYQQKPFQLILFLDLQKNRSKVKNRSSDVMILTVAVHYLVFILIIVTRNGKIVWKHRPSIQKSLWYLEIYQTAQNNGDQYQKTWQALKGISYLQELFMLLWIKQRLVYFKLQRSKIGNKFSCIEDSFSERFQP